MADYPELTFNIDNGYLEGIVRGFRGGILSRAEYLNLVQCETLEGWFIHHSFCLSCMASLIPSSVCTRLEGTTTSDRLWLILG